MPKTKGKPVQSNTIIPWCLNSSTPTGTPAKEVPGGKKRKASIGTSSRQPDDTSSSGDCEPISKKRFLESQHNKTNTSTQDGLPGFTSASLLFTEDNTEEPVRVIKRKKPGYTVSKELTDFRPSLSYKSSSQFSIQTNQDDGFEDVIPMSDDEDWNDQTKERWFELQRSTNVKDVKNGFLPEDSTLTAEQREVYELAVLKRESIFFTGSAGTGKSMLLQKIITALKDMISNEAVAVTATTGLAALNIGGTTLHYFAGIGLGQGTIQELTKKVRDNKSARQRWIDCNVLIIDESNRKKYQEQYATVWRDTDFFQLPPISKDNRCVAKFSFEARTWKTAVKHTIQLTRVFRQKDNELIELLNEMRTGKVSDRFSELIARLENEPNYPDDGIKPTELYPRNDNVNSANLVQLDKIPHKSHSFFAIDWEPMRIGQLRMLMKSCLAPQELKLKRDAQVMLIKNLKDYNLVNGSRGVVIGYHSNSTGQDYFKGEEEGLAINDLLPIVRFTDSNQKIVVEPQEWTIPGNGGKTVLASRKQIPLILAWAISIHKSQGQTLDRVKIDLGRVFEKGQAYVALSRATSTASLQVLNFRPTKVTAHEKVKAFYVSLRKHDDSAVQCRDEDKDDNLTKV
ncbi:150_t:CDS:2 [Gigaspora margarita]|uniref:ATP-dependent DNA helicase n=1 Tax=Gigaspora margarita TaxID=4874 RepID=A0ABN7UG76_GIGMA|nr:150_t:CDS:2 [Gigaspora margarita]